MQLSAALLLGLCLQVTASGISQTVTFKGKDVPLETVFNKVERQTGLVFVYTAVEIEKSVPVSIDAQQLPVEEFLQQLFKNQPLDFKLSENTVFVKKKMSVDLKPAADLSFLDKSPPLTGIIRDADGNPIAGVNIVVKGTKRGVTTDAAGKFSIEANANDILVISSIGFNVREVKINSTNIPIIVALEKSISKLDEVQIIAYGKTTQRLSTGNVTTVKADVIEKQPVNNPLLALQGRVPGLFIEQATGFAGTGVKVRIQGQNSMQNGNDPLYVVDGIPFTSQLLPGGNTILGQSGSTSGNNTFGNPFSYINPADIESIDVLKDADATAIYGSRAANGAILITTKKGKLGDTKIDLNLQSGWGKVPRKLNLMNRDQYLKMRNEALQNDGIEFPATGPYGDNDLNGTWDNSRNTDWQKELIGGSARYDDLNASVSGGSDLTTYLVGAGYHKEGQVFPGNFTDTKASVRFNINNNSANQKFRIQFSGNYLVDNNKLPTIDLTSNAVSLVPVAPALYNADGSINWSPDQSGSTTFYNPMGFLYDKYNDKTSNLIANALLSYNLIPGLDIKTSFGYNNLQSNTTRKNLLQSRPPEFLATSQRSSTFTDNNINTWIIEPHLNYKTSVSKGTLEILLGSTIQKSTSKSSSILGIGFSNDLIMDDLRSAPTVLVNTSMQSERNYSAFFGKVNYNWNDTYILNLTARRDGSSRFGPDNQFHNFAAIGAAWVFSQERIVKDNLSFLSFGKLRASYGSTGSDQIPDYQFLGLYNPLSQGNPYQGIIAYQPNRLTNPYLQWESTRKLQFGLDLGFLKDRILFNLNHYKNRSSNQLLPYTLPGTAGFGTILQNIPATVENSGWEFILSGTSFKTRNFSWSTSVNVTLPRTLLVEYPEIAKSSAGIGSIVGKPLGASYYFHYLGVDPATGVYQFEDSNGDPTTNPTDKDRTVVISPFPSIYGGFENTFRFKGFQLQFLLQFAKQIAQNYSFGDYLYYPGLASVGNGNQVTSLLKRWQKPGDVAGIQRFTAGYDLDQPYQNVMNSDASWSDASYIRLKNVFFSWQIPHSWKKAVHLQNCSFFLQGQNLLTITSYSGLDPETKSSTTLPLLRVITLGIKVTL